MKRLVLRRLRVVAGILWNDADEVLIAERLGDGPFHGLWEFPGGKIDSGEQPGEALVRELSEEIGVSVLASRRFLSLEHCYPDRHVGIEFHLVERWENEPQGLEGQALKWVAIQELVAAELLPADKPVIEALQSECRERAEGLHTG